MKKVRIGNDITVEWRIFRLGEEEKLAGKDVSVRVLDPYMKPVGFSYKIEGNTVSGVLEGRNQSRTGAYSILLVENNGKADMNTIDECNFVQLVSHTYMEEGSDEGDISTSSVSLSSDIAVPTNGEDGASAYDLAKKHGFEGTEAEWVASLVGATGKSAYEIAQEHGYTGTEEEWLASLQGQDGTDGVDGKSTYEIAVSNGYTGTEADFAREVTAKVVTSDKFIGKYDINGDLSGANVKYTPQALTDAQQIQARRNINACCEDDILIAEKADIEATIADPSLLTSAVRVTPQTWTEKEKEQARQNIDVADVTRVEVLEEKMAILDKTGVTVIGDITELTTDAKDYIVNAINEVDAHTDTNTEHIGDMDDLEVKDSAGVTAPDIVTALNIIKNSNGMTLVKETIPNAEMVATYTIYNGVDDAGVAIQVGQIDIPYDKVVLSGEMVVADGTEIIGKDASGNSIRSTSGHHYLVLSVANQTEKVWVDMFSLDYTAKQSMTGEVLQVQVEVDAVKREISATIGEDTITHVELDKKTEHELDIIGYDHNKDDDTHADYNKPQITTTAQTVIGAIDEIVEMLKLKASTYVVDALPDITNATVLAGLSEKDIYILHKTFDVKDADGNPVTTLDTDGVTTITETEDYYTPYRLSDDKSEWLCLYHRHEHETDPIDFGTELTWVTPTP